MNLFHYVSEYIYSWIKRQPKVKEETLTDWLLDRISTGCSRIVYQTFSRWEESQNGIDWEWWVFNRRESELLYRILLPGSGEKTKGG